MQVPLQPAPGETPTRMAAGPSCALIDESQDTGAPKTPLRTLALALLAAASLGAWAVDPRDRGFLSKGMSEGEVVLKIGKPDHDVWTAHFFGLYLIASLWLTTNTARVVAGVFTVACLAADGWLLWRTAPARRGDGIDTVDRWLLVLAFLGAAFSALAVLWQGLPALIV